MTSTPSINYSAAILHTNYFRSQTDRLALLTIGIIPPMGYRNNNQSVFAHKWLSYTADRNEIYIQHARNGGEKCEGDYLFDGYREETHTPVRSPRGCFWHGCPKCYARDIANPVRGKTMQELHHNTVAKIEYLKRKGYNVVEVWECDVNRKLKQNEEMKHYFDHYHMVNPLNPRHALYGG